MVIVNVAVNKIRVSEHNARGVLEEVDSSIEELAKNIEEQGLLHEPIVWRTDDEYELIIGQRRFLACSQILGWTEIPVKVVEAKNRVDAIMASISEGVHQEAIPATRGREVVGLLYDELESASEIARRLGKSLPWVRDMLVMKLAPQELARMIDARQITKNDVTRLVSIYYGKSNSEKHMIEAARKIAGKSKMDKDDQIEGFRDQPEKKPEQVSPKRPERIALRISIYSKLFDRLREAARDYGLDEPTDVASVAITEWLSQRYGPT